MDSGGEGGLRTNAGHDGSCRGDWRVVNSGSRKRYLELELLYLTDLIFEIGNMDRIVK